MTGQQPRKGYHLWAKRLPCTALPRCNSRLQLGTGAGAVPLQNSTPMSVVGWELLPPQPCPCHARRREQSSKICQWGTKRGVCRRHKRPRTTAGQRTLRYHHPRPHPGAPRHKKSGSTHSTPTATSNVATPRAQRQTNHKHPPSSTAKQTITQQSTITSSQPDAKTSCSPYVPRDMRASTKPNGSGAGPTENRGKT